MIASGDISRSNGVFAALATTEHHEAARAKDENGTGRAKSPISGLVALSLLRRCGHGFYRGRALTRALWDNRLVRNVRGDRGRERGRGFLCLGCFLGRGGFARGFSGRGAG